MQDVDAAPLGAEDAAGYLRNALGPLRPAPKEASGWLSAAGELGMTAHDLALWDISVIDQTVLRPASYRTMQTDVLLACGAASRYGLGVTVRIVDGRRQIAHGGAVSGYLTANVIYPDDRAAVVVLGNVYPGATGFDFQEPSPRALRDTVRWAQACYNDPLLWTDLARNGMTQDWSWERSGLFAVAGAHDVKPAPLERGSQRGGGARAFD